MTLLFWAKAAEQIKQNNNASFFILLILFNLHKVTTKPLAGKLEFHFSHTFNGPIWNMLLVPEKSILVLEVRNDESRQVSFSALEFGQNQFLWHDVRVSEPWWVNLFETRGNTVILSKFDTTNNPDSVSYISLDLQTGAMSGDDPVETLTSNDQHKDVTVPDQYVKDSTHFETVSKFIQQKLKCTPVHTIEYLENSGLIFISMYTQEGLDLENQLLIFDENGELLLRDKIGVALKGLGLETFFLRAGYLFYVKNKVELVTCRIIQPQ